MQSQFINYHKLFSLPRCIFLFHSVSFFSVSQHHLAKRCSAVPDDACCLLVGFSRISGHYWPCFSHRWNRTPKQR